MRKEERTAMLKKYFILPFLWCAFMMAVCGTVAASAAEPQNKEAEDKADIFVLDASNSMNSNDKNRLAIDSIAQLIYSLPSNYLTGVVTYNNQVVCATELVDAAGRASVMREAAEISYKSYTNAGDGLARAVELLKGMDAAQKTIVILSDGEIYMKTPEETTASLEQFQATVSSAAEQKIQIHVIGLGEEMTDPETNIFSAAHDTGGVRIQISRADNIPKAIETILVEHLRIKKSTAAIINASGEMDSIAIPLPYRNASKVRILLTSTGTIQNLITDFNASDAKQFNGTYYSLIEIANPSVETINIQLQGQAGSQVKADILPKYTVIARPEVLSAEYQTEGPANLRFRLRFYDARNPNVQLFTESIFENSPVNVAIEGNIVPTALTRGTLSVQYELTESRTLPFQFD
jgi:Ca-activated chloride channel family protein